MVKSLSILRILACSVLVVAASSVLGDESSKGFTFYLEYLEAASKAESVNEIAPFMPSWWRSRYESGDAESQAGVVERNRKSANDLRDVALEKEEPVDGGVRLHMTGKGPHDFPMRGNVLLLEESGSLTIEESMWATSQ